MRMRAQAVSRAALFCAVCPVVVSAHGQLVITPAIPVVGDSYTVTALQPPTSYPGLEANCQLVVSVVGQNFQGSFTYTTVESGGSVDLTDTYFPGFYQVSAYYDLGYNNSCESFNVAPTNFAVVQAGVSEVDALIGQYAFLCHGESTVSGYSRGMEAAIGTLTADGLGSITAGRVDFNSPDGALLNQPLTGSYTLDSTGTGELTLKTPAGAAKYALRASPLEVASPGLYYLDHVKNAVLTADKVGAGLDSCTLSAVCSTLAPRYLCSNSPPYGAYVLALSGETAPSAPLLPGVPLYGQQLLSFNGDNTTSSSGREFTASSPRVDGANLSGNFSYPDPITGRVTFTLAEPDEPTTSPTHFVAYTAVISFNQDGSANETHIYVMSTDSHANKDLVLATQPR